jgi:hypothetical protein
VLKDLARWVRRSTKERANGRQSSPRREDYSPGRRKGLHCLAQIRTFAISQREEFSLCISKFESDMPSHGVSLSGGIFQRGYAPPVLSKLAGVPASLPSIEGMSNAVPSPFAPNEHRRRAKDRLRAGQVRPLGRPLLRGDGRGSRRV